MYNFNIFGELTTGQQFNSDSVFYAVCLGYSWHLHLPFWTGLRIGPRPVHNNNEEILRLNE